MQELDRQTSIPDACEMCGKSYGLLPPQPVLQKRAWLLLLLGGVITTAWVVVVYVLAPVGTPLVLIAAAFIISPGTPVALVAGCFRRVLNYRCFHCGYRHQVFIR